MVRAAAAATRAAAAAAAAAADDAPYETIRAASASAAGSSAAAVTASLAVATVEGDEPEDEPQLLPITRAPELRSRLGQGSFGTVWSALDEHGRSVAVKVVPLHADAEEGQHVQVELEREITMMRQFRHRNVVVFHTAFRSAEQPEVWVAMELCYPTPTPTPTPTPNPN